MRVRLAALIAAVALTSSCRLSDPVYLFRELSPAAPAGPEESLLYGSIEVTGFLSAPISSVYFRRVNPGGAGRSFEWVTEHGLFRVFQPRYLKDGHFVISLRPGVYELDRLESESLLFGRTVYTMNEASRVASRIYITRPAVYDVGTLRINAPEGWFESHKLEAKGDSYSPERLKRLRAAIQGTEWEKRPLAGGQ
jgi:hypothetical protein